MMAYSMASNPHNCQPFLRARALPHKHNRKVCLIHWLRAAYASMKAGSDVCTRGMTASMCSSMASYVNPYVPFMPDLQRSEVCVVEPQTLPLAASGTLLRNAPPTFLARENRL